MSDEMGNQEAVCPAVPPREKARVERVLKTTEHLQQPALQYFDNPNQAFLCTFIFMIFYFRIAVTEHVHMNIAQATLIVAT